MEPQRTEVALAPRLPLSSAVFHGPPDDFHTLSSMPGPARSQRAVNHLKSPLSITEPPELTGASAPMRERLPRNAPRSVEHFEAGCVHAFVLDALRTLAPPRCTHPADNAQTSGLSRATAPKPTQQPLSGRVEVERGTHACRPRRLGSCAAPNGPDAAAAQEIRLDGIPLLAVAACPSGRRRQSSQSATDRTPQRCWEVRPAPSFQQHALHLRLLDGSR